MCKARTIAKTQGLTQFQGNPCKRGHSGLRYVSDGGCVFCSIQQATHWKSINPEKARATYRRWALRNPETVRLHNQTYYAANKDWLVPKNSKRTTLNRQTKIQVRIATRLRNRIWFALKGTRKGKTTKELLGCSFEAAKIYLEAKFQPGMSWANWSQTGWHIDHIKPLASFDLTDSTQLALACHYTNLQPLWAKDNLRKNARILVG